MLASLIAINWEPELRGILTVMIGTAVWMGSVYLILGTNLGARLGFQVSLAGFFGWMALMGGIWWIYGIGLKGEDASWQPVEGRTVIQEADLLHEAGVLDVQIDVTPDTPPAEASQAVADQLGEQGWISVDQAAPEYGQAQAAAEEFLIEEGAFDAGDFAVVSIYEVNPPAESAYPKLGPNGEFDQIAFFHKPYYSLVEVAPYMPLLDEPGRAPIPPEIDQSRQRQYVYMIRDLGSLREPAAYICIGSTIAFLGLCWLLHRRDRFVAENLSRKAVAAA